METMKLEQILLRTFGFSTFKKGQKQVVEKVLQHKSTLAIFPTGSGKSLCYQLPALHLSGLTLVVSPLLALMKDQLDFLISHTIAAARLDSSLDREQYNQILQQAKNKQLKILMISVERFKNERFRSQLKQMDISLMVVDEAHCISEWGHNFRPDYLKLPLYKSEFNIPQTLLLTATATKQVIDDMQHKFAIANDDVVITGFYRKNLFLQMSPSGYQSRKLNVLTRIQQNPEATSIIYVTLQKTAQELAAYLKENGILCEYYHAGMKSEERELLQNQFMLGKIPCIVATIAFGMGIDKADVRRVIHFDLPKSIENYSQEIGRAGRDGEDSLCELFANKDSLTLHENFVYGDTPEKQAIENFLVQIKQTQEPFIELKMVTASNQLNIRVLPFKTLLVYLEMEGVIKPKYTYFSQYTFKNIANSHEIINRFNNERKQFIAAIFNYSKSKKTLTHVNIPEIINNYPTDRQRIVTALEFFDEKGLIELQAKQAVERFSISDKHFDVKSLTDKMHGLFVSKESVEIKRIHAMLAFFGSDECLSLKLAEYFGEQLNLNKCGHCSHCQSGKANFYEEITLEPLQELNFNYLTSELIQAFAENISVENLSKALCGISMPVFRQHKIRQQTNFARLESYPFQQVKDWVYLNYKDALKNEKSHVFSDC